MVQPWSEIRSFYAGLMTSSSAASSMFALVSEIERSKYAIGPFGWTSVLDLCIAQTRVSYPYNGPYLRISPTPDGKIEFRYVDTPINNKQWHRTVDGSEGFNLLEHFIDQLHWFTSGF
jgi:hypothetical protein